MGAEKDDLIAPAGPTPRAESATTAWFPDLLYADGHFHERLALVDDGAGRIAGLSGKEALRGAARVMRLGGRALLPGLVNAHSHAFQRVMRGRTEQRSLAHRRDSFWTWREAMYRAAARLTPDDIYDASRMAFLEMVLSGITTVGEFHYLHRAPDGSEYGEPNLMAQQVVRAARDVGLRVCLLRTAYARSGFETPANARQLRFIEADAFTYLRQFDRLRHELSSQYSRDVAWAAVAPHSVRAVPLEYVREVVAYADAHDLAVHMHVAEQPAEVDACLREYGRTPVRLLADEGLIGPRFTGVHAIHITEEEARDLAAGAGVCACPTTERNLGDGIIPADLLLRENVSVALGTDSQIQIDLLEDARELEYHLRLRRLERAVLSAYEEDGTLINFPSGEKEELNRTSLLAARLFECATISGADSLGATAGRLKAGSATDFFTVDLADPAIAGAGADDLLSTLLFSGSRAAVRDVVIGGRLVVAEGHHPAQGEIVERFRALQKRLWT